MYLNRFENTKLDLSVAKSIRVFIKRSTPNVEEYPTTLATSTRIIECKVKVSAIDYPQFFHVENNLGVLSVDGLVSINGRYFPNVSFTFGSKYLGNPNYLLTDCQEFLDFFKVNHIESFSIIVF